MKRIAGLTVALAAMGAIAITGCGGSSNSGSSSSPSNSGLSKQQLAARADAQCIAYRNAATAIPQPKDFATNPVAAAAFLDKLKPLVAAQESAMLALKPDSSVKPLWDRFVAAGEHGTALFNDAVAKAHAKDRAGLTDLERLAAYKTGTADPIARQLGANACAK
jgi:hypothetical protein